MEMSNQRKKYLYLDCASGISGDMAVAALLDLGADRGALDRAMRSIHAKGFRVEVGRVRKSSIDCCDFRVILDKAHENHDHDAAYLYGSRETAEQSEERETHTHAHEADHGHRTLAEIEDILADVDMSDHALELAGRIFEILAEAEAKAHSVPTDQVHFHEVGAIDSIVDIVAASVCMDSLDADEVIIPRLCEGRGMVRTQHGLLPIPVPAVVNIAQAGGLNLEICDRQGEYVTPTGAAFAAAVMTSDHLPGRFRILATGLGAGKREQEVPGILRAMLIEPEETNPEPEALFTGAEEPGSSGSGFSIGSEENRKEKKGLAGGFAGGDRIWKLETNIDDCSGEALGYTLDRLLENGARDVHYTAVYMKKNRPGWLLTVLCGEQEIPVLERIIFEETTTIGIRRIRMERDILPRKAEKVMTPYGEIRVKTVSIGGRKKVYPEYESVAQAAKESGAAFETVYLSARDSYEE
ncbi:MAG: nickel pincer cofactor biosynthesis protein LarC [Bilifractor sp.]|jgi:uncharacterized protein (TIGR00299 family) protein